MQKLIVLNTFFSHLDTFLRLTESSDVEVRSSAGENIALVFEAMNKTGEYYHGKGEIIDRLFVLSKESNKRSSKRDRKEQRSVFRDVYKTVQV